MDNLINDSTTFEWRDEQNPKVNFLTFSEIKDVLISPDSKKKLALNEKANTLSDGKLTYPIVNNLPILFPEKICKYYEGTLKIPLQTSDDPLIQYFLLSYIKQSSDNLNANKDNVHYKRHLHRMKNLMEETTGSFLDIGCDDPYISSLLLPGETDYLGFDPFSEEKSDFKIIGVAEFLPFEDSSFNNVCFNTSLDHILDYNTAISEAYRVLKPGGTLYICSLLWTHNAELHKDIVHFHHFREFEIKGALSKFSIDKYIKYNYKSDENRYGLYLSAHKK
jgi:SAM-dependent methyltransferase